MKIVVTDPIVTRLADRFRELSPEHDWIFIGELSPEEQHHWIDVADVLVCAQLSTEQAQLTRARLIHITGTGTDRVAVAELAEGTKVCRTSHHERSIAEHVLMAVLAHQRRLLTVVEEMRSGQWHSVATDSHVRMHRTVDQLTVGFVGMGGICAETLRIFSGLDATCVGVRRNPVASTHHDASASKALKWIRSMRELPELLSTSDVVVLGVPLAPETRGLINTEALDQMKSDALLVNVSRGPVIDQEALATALKERRIGGAALDVWWGAPEGTAAPDSVRSLANLPGVIPTPHASGHALRTFEMRVNEIVDNINAFAFGRPRSSVVM